MTHGGSRTNRANRTNSPSIAHRTHRANITHRATRANRTTWNKQDT